MKTPLLPKQVENVAHMVARPDLPNYSEPGTGKTLATIGAIEKMGFDSGVVIAPPIALPMWKRVLETELGVTAHIVKTSTSPINGDYLVMSYAIASTIYPKLLSRGSPALVLDESHYLKTQDSKRTRAVFGPKCDGGNGIYETSKYCFTLTGTPIERHADDLWAQLRAIQPAALSKFGVLTYEQFRDRFTWSTLKQYHPRMRPQYVVTASRREDELNRLLYEEIGAIRNTMDDVAADMPPVTFRDISVNAVLDAETSKLLRGKSVDQIAAMLVNQDPIMTTARRLFGLAKIKDVTQYVMDSAANGPVLVGYWHTEFGKSLLAALQHAGVTARMINGETGMISRDNICTAFNSGECRVIVGQIAAMGVALNLQAKAHHVIVAEDDWSPGRIEQFYKRVWRMGQQNHVQVDFCVADTVVDGALAAVRVGKAKSSVKSMTVPTVGEAI